MTEPQGDASDATRLQAHERFPPLPVSGDLARALAQRDVVLEGLRGAGLAKLLADLRAPLARPVLVIVAEPEPMIDLVGDLELFGQHEHVFPFPAWDVLPSETDHPEVETAGDRVAVLRALQGLESGDSGLASPSGKEDPSPQSPAPPLVVAPITALMQPTLEPGALAQGHLVVRPGMEISPEALSAHLLEAGLEVVAQVDAPGQFSRRGGIMDVFPLFADGPLRIEFFGDEIDTLRTFSVTTQRSNAPLDQDIILVDVTRESFRTAYDRHSNASLIDFLPPEARLVLVHPQRIETVAELYASGFEAATSPLISLPSLLARMSDRRRLFVNEMAGESWSEAWGGTAAAHMEGACESLERLSGGSDTAFAELERLLDQGVEVTIFCHNAAERQRLHELLLEKGGGLDARVELALGHISKGFLAGRPVGQSASRPVESLSKEDRPTVRPSDRPTTPWAVLGDHEIFGRFMLRRTPRKRFAGAPLADFTELNVNDYVVHVVHGIARYEGVTAIEQNDTKQDYLVLRFAEEARVYVPLSHVDLVQRYVGTREARPALSKLGGTRWARRKRAAEKAVRDVAADLLRLQAVRQALPGIPYPEDDELQREFDAAFPYEETPDQLTALDHIKVDQIRPHPMDRLLCGDVGFGKTELAIRAAFKVVNGGKQVAVLVPTTILAEQHLRTFSERLADYPVLVASLSRFRSPAEQRDIVTAVQEGRVDIVIGTHRLLSQDVAFKDLGLVVIDEEQRFGVEHKERLKEMRASVDVLTMTATPIPRTLHMSLMGLRDISNLTTPPAERHAIRTIVTRSSDKLVRRAILRELARGGQCYFVHNRVHNIDKIASHLSALVPEARFGVGHGQMPEKDLLEVMLRFLDGRIDVLVCTTIIESGVDIPTVNTLFVNDADHFGLADLHQLRGRVGRYRHQAYAYFLVSSRRPVTPIAQKRLRALEEYSELGAGFRLALRDLEIRGAGNVLGLEQSGHIHQIGFDLYCRLLERAVAEFKGETVEEVVPVELDLGTRAFVPTEYIAADPQRVEFYRKLSACRDAASLENLRGYIRDRYGPLPEAVDQCFADQSLRQRAEAVGICFLGRLEDALVVAFAPGKGRFLVPRLRTLGRKVTPLEKARWRVGLEAGEGKGMALLGVVEDVLARLQDPQSEVRSGGAREGDRAANPAGRPRESKRHRRGLERELALVSSGVEVPKSVEADVARRLQVLGLEPLAGAPTLGVVVAEDSVRGSPFGPMTLIVGTSARYFLRCTGSSRAGVGRLCLTLQAGSAEEAALIVRAHLATGSSCLLPGVHEDD